LAVNLTKLGPQIPAETHMYWYTAETGVSFADTTRNMLFSIRYV